MTPARSTHRTGGLRRTPRIATGAGAAAAALLVALAGPAIALEKPMGPGGPGHPVAAEHPEAGPLTLVSAVVTGAAAGAGVWLLRRRRGTDDTTDDTGPSEPTVPTQDR
ncbi:hypothetical protein ABZ953_13880 [Streptomyces sp. NPDC046465]|uniref:hypothetical protein n=1 Tax=Streptomyces sp. NPDC046465 TaxID=3155810 RepID=UPI0033EC4CB1